MEVGDFLTEGDGISGGDEDFAVDVVNVADS